MTHGEITSYAGDRTKVRVTEARQDRPARLCAGHCEDHASRHETLDLTGFSVEKGDAEWVPKDGVIISYCEECIDEERDYELRDAPPADVVAELITGPQWTSQHRDAEFRGFFDPVDLAEGRELRYCPFCGSEFSMKNDRTGRATCPDHGDLNVDAQQLRGH